MPASNTYTRQTRRRPAEEAEVEAESSAHARKRQAREEAAAAGVLVERSGDAHPREPAGGDDGDEEPDLTLLPFEEMPVSDRVQKAAEALGEDALRQKAYDLVRLALACEYTKASIKRDDISKKILNGRQASYAFAVIFNRAQKVLRSTFGYVLVELRPHGAENAQLRMQTQATLETQGAESTAGSSPRKGKTSDKGKQAQKDDPSRAKAWALRSALPIDLIGRLAAGDPELADALEADAPATAVGADEAGTVLDWKKADLQLGGMGLLYLILSLILLSGRAISQGQLLAYLRRLELEPETRLPSRVQPDGAGGGHGGESMTQSGTQRAPILRNRRGDAGHCSVDDFLYLLRKQSYLERVRTDAGSTGGATQATQRHLGRTRMRDDEEGATYEWRWGSRAEAEISEEGVARMVERIFHDHEAAAEDEDGATDEQGHDAEVSRRRREQRRQTLLRDIEVAAGSALFS